MFWKVLLGYISECPFIHVELHLLRAPSGQRDDFNRWFPPRGSPLPQSNRHASQLHISLHGELQPKSERGVQPILLFRRLVPEKRNIIINY